MQERPKPGVDPVTADPFLGGAPLMEGFRVLDPAVLYAKIGEGGMGAVYRGRHVNLDLDVAVKCLRPELAHADPGFIKRFEQEARLAASITHQNVVRVMQVQEKNGIHYLVMEFVAGETAQARVRRKKGLKEREALAIITGAATGLAEAHAQGIVHRDIKPENIMISTDGRVKLADLGLAKATGASEGRSLTMHTSVIMGTPAYMPPEQWDSPNVGPPADIWALGATLFTLLAGRSAFAGPLAKIARAIQEEDFPSLRADRPDVRPEVHDLLERCVRRDPAQRFPNAKALLKELRALGHDEEEDLIDPESGSKAGAGDMVTPPPRQTLLRIKAKIAEDKKNEEAGGQTMATEMQRPRRRAHPALIAALGVAVLVLVWIWYPREPAPVTIKTGDAPIVVTAPGRTAQQAYDEGLLSFNIGDLGKAISSYQEALRLEPTMLLARDGLVAAHAARSDRNKARDLDAAFVDLEDALRVHPGNTAIEEKQAELAAAIRGRMLSNFALTSPDPRLDRRLQSTRDLQLAGSVSIANLKSLQFAVSKASAVPADADWQPVSPSGGAFRAKTTVAEDGDWFVHLRATDLHELQAMPDPLKVVVDSQKPVIEVEHPVEGQRTGRHIVVKGRVVDSTRCTLKVGDTAVTLNSDGSWETSLEVDKEGDQVVTCEAKDEAGLISRVSRKISADVSGPRIRLDPIEGVVKSPSGDVMYTRHERLTVAGTVNDDVGLASLQIGGQSVPIAAGGTFAASIVVAAVDAPVRSDLVAIDKLGNESRVSLSIQRHTKAPRLEVLTPAADALVGEGEVEFAGKVTGPTKDVAVATVTVDNVEAALTQGAFTGRVAVAGAGAHTITVTARDVLGNEATVTRSIKVMVLAGEYVDSVGGHFLRVRAAQFTMGSPDTEEGRRPNERQVVVAITQDCWLGETEVTQQQYQAVMGEAPWASSSLPKGDSLPAACISWFDAVSFCSALTQLERSKGRLPPGYEFRLPTEAEWEMAARAGSSTAYCYGDDKGRLPGFAVFYKSTRGSFDTEKPQLSQVRSREKNAFGFYDMHGNVGEWCVDEVTLADPSGTGARGVVVNDPWVRGGNRRVLRGGSWNSDAGSCRSAVRNVVQANEATTEMGFRVVLVKP